MFGGKKKYQKERFEVVLKDTTIFLYNLVILIGANAPNAPLVQCSRAPPAGATFVFSWEVLTSPVPDVDIRKNC